MKTTLYNHVALGTAEMPLIPNREYKKLIEDLQAGNKDALNQAKEKWTLEFSQLRIAQSLLKEIQCKP